MRREIILLGQDRDIYPCGAITELIHQMSDDNGDHPALQNYQIDEDYTRDGLEAVREDDADTAQQPADETAFDGADDAAAYVEAADAVEKRLTTDQTHRIAFSVGDGAATRIDNLIDEKAVEENDGRSNTRTMFYASESASEQQYKRLAKLNDGMYSPDRKQQNAWADKKRWVDGFTSYVEMDATSEERVFTILKSLNMKHMGPYSTEKVILAIISIVANEHNRRIRSEDGYYQLVEDCATTLDEVSRVRRLVMEKCPIL